MVHHTTLEVCIQPLRTNLQIEIALFWPYAEDDIAECSCQAILPIGNLEGLFACVWPIALVLFCPKSVKVYEFELGFFFEHSLSWCIAFELFFLLRFRKRSSKIHWLSVLFAEMKRINRCFPNAVDNNELVLGVLWIFLANLWRTIPQNMSVNNGPFVNRNHQ